MENSNDEFLIDVVKEHKYQNQNKEYCQSFFEWRKREKNKYGYKFVHDKREHTYVDGQGYIEKKPGEAEKKTLLKCCSILSLVMILYFALDLFSGFAINYIDKYYSANIADVPTSDVFETTCASVVLAKSFLNVISLVIPIIVFMAVLKLPKSVMLPKSESNRKYSAIGVILSLVIMIVGRASRYFISGILTFVNIKFDPFDFVYTDNLLVMTIFFVVQCFAVPILMEILFRGIVMQTFRQFGDFFAIIIAAFATCLCYSDITEKGYYFVLAFVIGMFTMKTGSISTAFLLNCSAQLVSHLINYFMIDMTYFAGMVYQLVVCMVVLIGMVIVYTRLLDDGDWSFNIDRDNGYLSTREKVKVTFTSNMILLLLIASVITTFVSLRFI